MQLDGRSAIVTGGAGGLGAATARHLVSIGMGVAVFDRDADRAAELAKELGDGAVAADGDVNDDADVGAAIEARTLAGPALARGQRRRWRARRWPHRRPRRRDRTTRPRSSATMEMNAFGTFNVSRLAAAAMADNEPDDDGQRGVIVNTGSIAGLEGQTGQIAYAAAKAAILGMTLPMARDLAPIGVRVCAIAPGTMGTPLMLGVPEATKDKLVESIVFPKRMGRPEEFALLVESIARNPYLNGETIRLDGALRFPPK